MYHSKRDVCSLEWHLILRFPFHRHLAIRVSKLCFCLSFRSHIAIVIRLVSNITKLSIIVNMIAWITGLTTATLANNKHNLISKQIYFNSSESDVDVETWLSALHYCMCRTGNPYGNRRGLCSNWIHLIPSQVWCHSDKTLFRDYLFEWNHFRGIMATFVCSNEKVITTNCWLNFKRMWEL